MLSRMTGGEARRMLDPRQVWTVLGILVVTLVVHASLRNTDIEERFWSRLPFWVRGPVLAIPILSICSSSLERIVRSSTSSSRSGWMASWLVALVLVVGSLMAWEVFWRSHDFVPSVNDDAGLWAIARKRANALGPDAVVLVGSSRMQMDIHREAFAEVTGWKPAVQLAAVRGTSVPVLRSLAEDPDFRGSVICEVNPVLFFARTPRIDQVLQDYVASYESFTIAKEVEQRLRMLLQRSLVTRLPSLAPEKIWAAIQSKKLPKPGYNAVVTPDRYRYGDYQKFQNLRAANFSNARLAGQARPKRYMGGTLDKRMRTIEKMVEQIRERGGQVVFIHLPTTLHIREKEQQWFTREKWWHVFARKTSALTIHYEDYPQLARFRPPDGEHLGKGAAVLFSRRFGELLVRLSVAPGPGD